MQGLVHAIHYSLDILWSLIRGLPRDPQCEYFRRVLELERGHELVRRRRDRHAAVSRAEDARDGAGVPEQVDTLGRAGGAPQAHLGVHAGGEDAPVGQVRYVTHPLGVPVRLCVQRAPCCMGLDRHRWGVS